MKSHVSMVRKICIVTGQEYDTGEILLDRRMKDSLEETTVVGYGFAPEIQEQLDKGYTVLVEADPEKSTGNTPDTVYRTGRYCFVENEVARKLFNSLTKENRIAYIEPGAYEWLIELVQLKKEEE